MYIAQSHGGNVQWKLHIHKKKSPIAILQEKVCTIQLHTKRSKVVQKYQRHYERFFGDETKVQKSQGNRANERKQSSSCLCFLKDNQTSVLSGAWDLDEREGMQHLLSAAWEQPIPAQSSPLCSSSGQVHEPFLALLRPKEPDPAVNCDSYGDMFQQWALLWCGTFKWLLQLIISELGVNCRLK